MSLGLQAREAAGQHETRAGQDAGGAGGHRPGETQPVRAHEAAGSQIHQGFGRGRYEWMTG